MAALLARRAARWVARLSTPVERCIFVGSDESFKRLQSKLPTGDRRATLVGRMALNHGTSDQMVRVGTRALHRLIENVDAHRVIIEPSEALPQITLDFVREAKSIGVRVSLLPRILEVVGSTIEVDDVNGLTLLGVRRFGLSRTSKLIKRSFDAVGSALGLLAASPLLLVVAILIKLDSDGPVIFRQSRVGRDGRAFEMWKFRTMLRARTGSRGRCASARTPRWACSRSATIPASRASDTGCGAPPSTSCRSSSMSCAVEMSLVGPRPLVADEDEQIIGRDRSRLDLTPGMTGHWQIQEVARTAGGNGEARLPLRRRLVALAGRPDPSADGCVYVRAPRDVTMIGCSGRPGGWQARVR